MKDDDIENINKIAEMEDSFVDIIRRVSTASSKTLSASAAVQIINVALATKEELVRIHNELLKSWRELPPADE